MSEKKGKQLYLEEIRTEEAQQNLLKWWREMHDDKGERARLRRCETPTEAALCKSVFRLRILLPFWNNQPEILATLAGILSHVENHNASASFARQLAQPKEGGSKPLLSEHRFQKLMKSRDWNEFYQSLRRVLQLMHKQANVLSLADGIIRWGREYGKTAELPPGKGLNFFWSNEFFTEYIKHENK